MAKHVHSDVIKAWADGEEIEVSTDPSGPWHDAPEPGWVLDLFYRVKPKQQERWVNIYNNDGGFKTKEEADFYAASRSSLPRPHRIACVKIVFTEGDGL